MDEFKKSTVYSIMKIVKDVTKLEDNIGKLIKGIENDELSKDEILSEKKGKTQNLGNVKDKYIKLKPAIFQRVLSFYPYIYLLQLVLLYHIVHLFLLELALF